MGLRGGGLGRQTVGERGRGSRTSDCRGEEVLFFFP